MMKQKDFKKIKKLLEKGNSELNLELKAGYIEIYGYVSTESILSIIRKGYLIYHSKLNDSAMVVHKK